MAFVFTAGLQVAAEAVYGAFEENRPGPVCGFRGLRVKGLGFKGLEVLGFRVQGFRVLRVWGLGV